MSEMVARPRSITVTLGASVVVASLALVLFVLPAEFGIDPTGAGEKMGIAGMSGYSVSALSKEPASYTEDYIEFLLAPFESIEYKYTLDAGQSMVYSWTAQAEVVFDFHSEQAGTDPEDAVSFSVGRGSADHGTYVAPFAGIHGWFWENRGQEDVTVKLKTTGFYTEATTFSRVGENTKTL